MKPSMPFESLCVLGVTTGLSSMESGRNLIVQDQESAVGGEAAQHSIVPDELQ
jgi:hypothetical protein